MKTGQELIKTGIDQDCHKMYSLTQFECQKLLAHLGSMLNDVWMALISLFGN